MFRRKLRWQMRHLAGELANWCTCEAPRVHVRVRGSQMVPPEWGYLVPPQPVQ